MNILSCFGGGEIALTALKELGVPIGEYYSSEIDPAAIRVSTRNHPEIKHLGDIRNVKAGDLPKIDLILAGSPCQDMSVLKQDAKGLQGDKSSLFFEFYRLWNELGRPTFLLENVKPKKVEWKEAIDRYMGVEGVLINSDLFVQQNRPRVYWTDIPIAPLPERPDWQGDFYQYRRTYFRKNKSGVCPCLTANMGTGGHNVPLKSEDKSDRLTPEECEALQGWPDGYTEGASLRGGNAPRYKMIGNGWTLPVIRHILKRLL